MVNDVADLASSIIDGSVPPAFLQSSACPVAVADFFADERWAEEGFEQHAVLHPEVDVERIRRLSLSPDRRARVAAASSPRIPEDVAQRLAQSSDKAVLGSLAMNTGTAASVLIRWLQHPELRDAVLGNRGLPLDLLADVVAAELPADGPIRYLFAHVTGSSDEPDEQQAALLDGVSYRIGGCRPDETMRAWAERVDSHISAAELDRLRAPRS